MKLFMEHGLPPPPDPSFSLMELYFVAYGDDGKEYNITQVPSNLNPDPDPSPHPTAAAVTALQVQIATGPRGLTWSMRLVRLVRLFVCAGRWVVG